MSLADFYQERLEKAKEALIAVETAVLYLAENPTRSFRLDTGQSEEEVTRYDLVKLNSMIDSLQGRIDYYASKLSCSTTINIPGW